MQSNRANKNFLQNNSGTSLIVVAFMFAVLMIVVAMVLNIGRMYAVQAKAQNAADAALLGAVATRDTVDVGQEFVKLFNANYPDQYMGSLPKVSVQSVTEGPRDIFTVNFTVSMNGLTDILDGFKSTNTMNININSQVTTCTGCTKNKLEMAMVLDNTGSMTNTLGSGETKIDALKIAAGEMTDILFGDAATLKNLRLSVVPYNIVVQIGTGHDSWIQSYPSDINYDLPVSGSATNNTNSLPKYQALENGTLVGIAKGFAGNRFTDYLCGPYLQNHFDPGQDCTGFVPQCITCTGFVPQCNTTTCDGFVPVCNNCAGFVPVCTVNHGPCDPETGKCAPDTTSCSTCTPSCTSCTPHTSCTSCTPSCSTCNPRPPSNTTTRDNYTCVANGLSDTTDEPPTHGDQYKFRLPFEGNLTPDVENPNCCGNSVDDHTWPQTLAPMLFDSNVKADVHTAINAMQAGGDTRVNVGLMWGWFTLSPKWQGLWDSAKPDLPAPIPNDGSLQKALMLMTDGKNVFGGDDTKTLAMCDAIKASGITIYTVGLGAPGDLNETLLQQCASIKTYYFNAPTTDELKTIFHQIGDIVDANLAERLSK